MDLIIVESPTKAKTLARFLGKKYQVEATYGHVRDLPKSKMGVDVEKDFEITYVSNEKQKKKLGELKKLVKKSDNLFLATDPDREGEAIAWHVNEEVKSQKSKAKTNRIEFHEITKNAIEEALKNPREVDMRLVDAQQARRVLDRLVGYKLSPLLWRKVKVGLSAGRVQSVVVRLVVEKEREIEQFNKVEYWEIEAEVKRQTAEGKSERQNFKAKLLMDIADGETANKVKTDLEKVDFVVGKIEKKEFKRTPPAPFTTSTLQQNAANKLGWSAKKVMQVAQGLYEEGLITYHRTDSTNIAVQAVEMAKKEIIKMYGERYSLDTPRFYKTKSKVAQEAHEAIRPTDVAVGSEQVAIGSDQKRLYELIWKRFVATQMAQVEGESTKVEIKAGEYKLEARGEVILFEGWYKLNDKPTMTDDQSLPVLAEGEELELINVESLQKFTQPPARYNDASIIKTLEEMGIGRPSTYAPTLSTVLERRYVEKEDKRYKPTHLGVAVNDFLVQHFDQIVDYDFTAKLEDTLDSIANGEKEWKPVIADFYNPFAKKLEVTQETAERVKVKVESTGEKCPKCGEGEQVIRVGKYGKFLACSRFPDCDFKDKYEIKVGVCPKCGGDIVKKRSKKGRTFYGCNTYPKCDYASWDLPKQVESSPIVE